MTSRSASASAACRWIGRFTVRWGVATSAAAVAISVCDALLLERSRGYFTGGFLSTDYLQRPIDVVRFFVASLTVDAAVIGLPAALVAWGAGRTRLHAHAALCAGVLTAAAALLVVDLVAYQVLRYLGDSFDLSLMLDLVGGRVEELFAVASGHLAGPILLAVLASAMSGGIVWAVNRYSTSTHEPPPASMLAVPALVGIVGLIVLTVAATTSDALENGLLRKPAGRLLAFVANRITDVDGDGVGIVGRTSDPDPFNGAVFPYAVDVPGNGIDEDGVGGDLPPDAPRFPEPQVVAARWQRRPDVVLVLLESFRADLVGAQHAGRAVTPVLDALAARGVSSGAAYSHNGYTIQSRHHLLTGSLVGSADGRTLIDDFRANGYVVGYFSGQDESFGGPEYDVGFGRADVAYDARADRARRYTSSTTPGSLAVPHTVVQERVDEFLRSHGAGEAPLFLYVNFHDTHFPYWHDGIEPLISPVRLARGEIAPGARGALWAMYVNTAANVDRAVGRLLEAIRRARGGEPGIVVTADHGESLFDEGFLGHAYGLNDVQTRVPFIVANLPVTVSEPVGQIDLRHMLGAALSRSPDVAAAPTIRSNAHRALFQYLGDLSRPRQIAFLRGGTRVIYDFRSGHVRVGDGRWLGRDDLPRADRAEFLQLVQQWEWMNLARRTRGAATREAEVAR